MTLIAFYILLIYLTISAIATSSIDNGSITAKSFDLIDLLTGHRSNDLATILATTGLFTVRFPSNHDYPTTRRIALQGLCECQKILPSMSGIDTLRLGDGLTIRNTLATGTLGKNALPLPKEELRSSCGKHVLAAMEALRDQLSTVSYTFIHALDRLLIESDSQFDLLRNSDGKSYQTISSIVEGALNLEHFHVYSKNSTGGGTFSKTSYSEPLSVHTDAGIFLVFVPAHECHIDKAGNSNEKDHSFFIQDRNNHVTPVNFPSDSVAVMLGAGAEHWLQTRLQLRATPHSVRMKAGSSRAWYGIMHSVPDDAIIQSSPEKTFADLKKSMVLSVQEHQVGGNDLRIGCGNRNTNLANYETAFNMALMKSKKRRRLHTEVNPSHCNNVTNFFCWMSCLDIPQKDQTHQFLNEGYSLYCLDPGVLAASGNNVSEAIKPCDGSYPNDKCIGSWQRSAPNVVNVFGLNAPTKTEAQFSEHYESSENKAYCHGRTSMYMDGFHWSSSVCLIYLLPGWIISSTANKLAANTITIVIGVLLEFVLFSRRNNMLFMSAGVGRLIVSALLYGVQLTLGYILMLVVMTYNILLFICVVLGLAVGHILFNAKDAILSGMRPQQAGVQKDTQEYGSLSCDQRPGQVESYSQEISKKCSEVRQRKNKEFDPLVAHS